ncbi:Glucan endo-1,6-beta-glucosidase B [Lachnellula suecica]|uniref:glucan endo-1,6-beta-glucosidase n=1 Tax=Lachnellula suecica TaxID=602035 RepID=A0A8T9CNK8_9HELO|nr:Glucan endo-1,6-beta-glucosidase B [Lachnellula suecica]
MIFTTILGLILTLLATPISAWLPGEQREIYALDGKNLFNQTSASNSTSKRWLPASGKIRGVNLGSLFVLEPWLAQTEWNNMGCGPYASEFDCVSALGQGQANAVFQNHWNSWITQGDITQMQSYGLNTIRIPVGYWMMESLVYSDSEHFPQGGLAFLSRVCGWASNAGFYIIIDLHGAPGAQVPRDADTGQAAPSAGFYQDYQFDRATTFLNWLRTTIHNDNNFRNVGMIGIVNEPIQDTKQIGNLRSSYYPNAYAAIRKAESDLGISSNNYVHVQPMNSLWLSGDPKQYLTNQYFMAYDDHRYLKRDPLVTVSQSAYMTDACHDVRSRDGDTPTVVGEFSISVPDDVQWTPAWAPGPSTQSFYTNFFAALVQSFERDTNGWVYWTWKSQLGDYRWSYQDAVAAGVIPTNPGNVNPAACNGF